MSDRTLMFCTKHDEPAWLYGDGSVQCMYDLITESTTTDHTLERRAAGTRTPPFTDDEMEA